MVVRRIRLKHGVSKKEIPTFAEVPRDSFILIFLYFTPSKHTSNQSMVPFFAHIYSMIANI